MQKVSCHWAQEPTNETRSKLQNQYKMLSVHSPEQFAQDFMGEVSTIGNKVCVNQLYRSKNTQSGEAQTLQSIREERKSVENEENEVKEDEIYLRSVVNQNKQKTNLDSLPISLLSVKLNNPASDDINLVSNKQQTRVVSNKKINEAGFEMNEFNPRQSQEIAGYNACSLMEQTSQKHQVGSFEEIKTLKLVPLAAIKFSEFGCQSDLNHTSILLISTESSSEKVSSNKVIQENFEEQHKLLANTQQSNVSLDRKVKQKLVIQIPLRPSDRLKASQSQPQELSYQTQKQDKDDIWQRDFGELEHQQLNLMQERYSESQNQSSQNLYFPSNEQNLKQIEQLIDQNRKLSMEVSDVQEELNIYKKRYQQLERKNAQLEAFNRNINQRLRQLLQENKQLICLIQQYKKSIYNFQLLQQSSHTEIDSLQKQINGYQLAILQKDEEMAQIQKHLKIMKEESSQLQLINTQLQQVLKVKSQQLQEKIQELQKQKGNCHEVIDFYKERLNNDGVILNIEQLKYIKDFIENQRQEQSQKIQNIQNYFEKQLLSYEQQKQSFIQTIAKLKQQRQSLAHLENIQRKSILQAQIEEIMKQYDKQLESRDLEILALKQELKKQREYQKQFCYTNCAEYIAQVTKLADSIGLRNGYFNQLEAQFVYVVDKLSKIHALLLEKNKNLEQEKSQLLLLFRKLEDFYQGQLNYSKKQLHSSQIQKGNLEQNMKAYVLQVAQLKKSLFEKQSKGKKEIIRKAVTPLDTKKKNNSFSKGKMQSQHQLKEQKNCNNFSKIIFQTPQKEQQKQDGRLLKFKKIISQNNYTYFQKLKIGHQIVQALQKKIGSSKKVESILINQIYLKEKSQNFEIQFIRQSQKEQDSTNQKQMLYFAPQVLLGFAESEQSYVWTLGLLLDELFHGSLFYKKLNEIKSRTENYNCRNTDLKIKDLLQCMLKKNHKIRISLAQIKLQISKEATQSQYVS